MNVWLTPDVLRDPPSRWVAVGGIALAVVAMPVGNIQVPGLGTALILPATAAACVVTAMVLFAARQPIVVPSAVLAFAGADVAVTAIAVLRSGDPAVGLRLTLTATAGLVLAVLTAAVCSSVRFWYGLLGVLLAVGAAVCLASLNSALSLQASFGGAVVTGRLTGVFGQPNELGGFAAVVAVLAVGVLVTTRRIAAVVGTLMVLASALAALALSLSRGSWIGVVAGIAVLAIALPQARRRLVVTAAALTLVLVGAAVVSPGGPSAAPRTGVTAIIVDRAATVLGPDSNPFDERPSIWREALRQIESSPVLGQGPGNFPLRAEVSSAAAPSLQADHAHNLMLTTAAETGLLGLAFLVCAVVAGVVAVGRVLRAPEGAHRQGAATAAAALTVVLGQGLVDYPLRNAVLATLTWLLIGLLVAATATPVGAQRSSDSEHDPPAVAVGTDRG